MNQGPGEIPETAARRKVEYLSLAEAAEHLLEECRMVLPGLQALFGFQLIAVFNNRFGELRVGEQVLHLMAITLVAIAVALIMTPAAYHRQTSPRSVSEDFIRLSTRLLVWSMLPLCLGICLDFYLIARLILDPAWAAALSLALLSTITGLWFAWPNLMRVRDRARITRPESHLPEL